MISFKDVSKTYKNGTRALFNVDLEIADREFVYIVGPTGSGKSTLVKILNAEELPTSGEVMVNGVDVGKLRFSKVPMYRRSIGVVFQDYRLLPKRTVYENVAYALEVLDKRNDEIRERVKEVLELVDLSDKANSFTHELSGGQQQRVAIARAIANNPKILIADEPTGNLDPRKSIEIIQLLEKINIDEETTILMVTHDAQIVQSRPKRMVALEAGHVVGDLKKGDEF